MDEAVISTFMASTICLKKNGTWTFRIWRTQAVAQHYTQEVKSGQNLTFPATSKPKAPTTRILISVLPGPEGQIFPANFLTIAQSVNRCSLSETFFASSSATVVVAVGEAFSTLAGEGVPGIGFEEADLVAPCDGVFMGSEFARCRYVLRKVVSDPADRSVAAFLPITKDPCKPDVVLDIGRKGMPKPTDASRQLAWRIADTICAVDVAFDVCTARTNAEARLPVCCERRSVSVQERVVQV